MVGSTFPNVQMFCTPSSISWRVFMPRGPERFEQMSWALVERDAPEPVREMVTRATLMTFGTSGMIESDDSDTWPWQTSAARGAMGRRQKLRYQATRGETNRPAVWAGPGSVYDGLQKDDNQWAWWLRYRAFMTGAPW
jgi:hypothetical protein